MDNILMAMAMNAVSSAPPAQSQPAQQDSPQTVESSFSKILQTLAKGQAPAEADAKNAAGKMTWRDVQAANQAMALSGLTGNGEGVTVDPVLAQLLELLKGFGGGGKLDLSGKDLKDILSLLEKMQQRLQKILEENGSEVAGQQLLAIFASLVQQFTGQAPTEEAMQAVAGDVQGLLQQVLAAQPDQLAALLPELMVKPPEDGKGKAEASYSTVAASAKEEETDLFKDVTRVDTQKGQAPQAENLFSSQIRIAKEQMQTDKPAAKADDGDELDIDKLQQMVDSGAFTKNTVMDAEVVKEAVPMPEQPLPVETQIENSLAAAIKNGQQQLTIHLAPEELGEVTIQLTKTAEGMLLNIVAKVPETQQLLNGSIDALKDSLRAMKVEVQSIVTEQQQEMLASQQDLGGRHQRSWQEMHGAAYYGDEPLAPSTDEAESVAAVAAKADLGPASMLNTAV